jgi:AI-2 transport protein TqsA
MPSRAMVSRIPVRLESSVRVIVLLASLVIIGFGVHSSRNVIVPLLLALGLVLAVQPLVEALERRTGPAIAVALGMTTVLTGIGVFFAIMAYGANQFLTELPRYENAFKSLQSSLVTGFASRGLTRLALVVQNTQVGSVVASHSVGWMSAVPDAVTHGVFVLVLTLFMLIERNSVKTRLLTGVAQFARDNAHIVSDVQRYLGTKTLVSILTGLLVTLLCVIFGLSNAPLWGALAFVCNFIPVAGALISALPPIALAVLSRDATAILGLSIGFLLIKAVVGNFLEPRLLGNSCGLSPLAVVISIVVWGALLGPTGALLSVPLTSAFRIALSHVHDFQWLDLLITVPDGTSTAVDTQAPRPPQPRPLESSIPPAA